MLETRGLGSPCGPLAVMRREHELGRLYLHGMEGYAAAASAGDGDAVQWFIPHGQSCMLAVIPILATAACPVNVGVCAASDGTFAADAQAILSASQQEARIRARVLEDVFKELARSWQVNVHWLAVNAEPRNVDNKPRDDFEREAVKQLAAGKPEYEALEGNLDRFAGSIRLSSQCLKCHAPRRTSTEDRFAGLVISMRLAAGRGP